MIHSRLWCREYPRRQIHGIPYVHQRQIERNRSALGGKMRIPLHAEFDGRQFDADVSDPFLETFSLKYVEQKKINNYN